MPIYAELPTVLEIAAILYVESVLILGIYCFTTPLYRNVLHSISSSVFSLVTKWGPSIRTIHAITSAIVEGPDAAEKIE